MTLVVDLVTVIRSWRYVASHLSQRPLLNQVVTQCLFLSIIRVQSFTDADFSSSHNSRDLVMVLFRIKPVKQLNTCPEANSHAVLYVNLQSRFFSKFWDSTKTRRVIYLRTRNKLP